MAAMLDGMVDKVVQIVTNDGRNIVGMLKGFDQTTNVILDECHERVFSPDAGVEQARGDGGHVGRGGEDVARVALARVVERVAVRERVVGRAVVARAAAAELEAVGAFARAPPDGPRAPAASLSRLSSLRSQVQLGLYIVRGDNMCAPAPRCRRH